MEGHDYAIGIDSDGKMYRQDVAEENGEIEPYPIDDVIDTVCEWNYELILVPAQLVQIKSAIEKGLTESQLVELINNNISAEKMKEIIEIAVLENSMAD